MRPELNGLFREEDYPSPEALRGKFSLRLEILPIPSGDDFRVTLSEEEKARVARDIDDSVRRSLQRGTDDLWARLTATLTRLVDRLSKPESRFHASLVSNVLDLAELLPSLNLNRDEALDRFAAEVRSKLQGFTAQQLREDDTLRAAAAVDTAGILYDMQTTLRDREQGAPVTASTATEADDIFARMSAYMEAPTA